MYNHELVELVSYGKTLASSVCDLYQFGQNCLYTQRMEKKLDEVHKRIMYLVGGKGNHD